MKRLFTIFFNLGIVILIVTSCNLTKKEVDSMEIIQTEVISTETDNSQDKGKVFSKLELQEDFNQLKTYISSHHKLYTDVDTLNNLLESNYELNWYCI